ncbi:MAG TPA: hypothetical protein VLC09_04385 [Polyangiaceae bacterium]|nr:hypothetical protein [Polyangiaceae bacterium]
MRKLSLALLLTLLAPASASAAYSAKSRPSARLGLNTGFMGAFTEVHTEISDNGSTVPYDAFNAAVMGPVLGLETGVQLSPEWAILLRANGATLFLAWQFAASANLEWSPSARWSFASGLGWEAQVAEIGNMRIAQFTNGMTIPLVISYRFRDSQQTSHSWLGLDVAAGAYDNSYIGGLAFTSHAGLLYGYAWDL